MSHLINLHKVTPEQLRISRALERFYFDTVNYGMPPSPNNTVDEYILDTLEEYFATPNIGNHKLLRVLVFNASKGSSSTHWKKTFNVDVPVRTISMIVNSHLREIIASGCSFFSFTDDNNDLASISGEAFKSMAIELQLFDIEHNPEPKVTVTVRGGRGSEF